jgi:hypothetical protein
MKYLLIGVLFLIGAVVLWMVAKGGDGPPEAPPVAVPEVERVNPMKEPQLELDPEPEPEPEPEVPPEEEPAKAKATAPRKAASEWDCSGDLPGALKVINENRAQVRSCYERRLKVNNILQGNLTLKLRVGSNGKVTSAQLGGTLQDQEVYSCVRSLAQGWTFPVPSGGSCAVVEVPFQFSPKP